MLVCIGIRSFKSHPFASWLGLFDQTPTNLLGETEAQD